MAFIEFSTRNYLRHERMDAVRETYAAMASVEPDIPDDSALDLSIHIRLLPGVSVAFVDCSPLKVSRGPRQLADGNDDISLFLNPGGAGSWVVRQRGLGELECSGGSGCIGLNERPGRIDLQGPRARFLSITFARERLLPLIADFDGSLRRSLHGTQALRLLAQQVLELTRPGNQALSSPCAADDADRLRMSNQLLDLSALALGATPQAKVHARARGLRQARLKAIQADLRVNARHGDLSLEWVAARHAISERYIRALFEQENTTFSDYLLELRLQRALGLLSSPLHAHSPVNTIAYDAGFNNLSWFYRAFKRRFAMTPSDARQLHADAASG